MTEVYSELYNVAFRCGVLAGRRREGRAAAIVDGVAMSGSWGYLLLLVAKLTGGAGFQKEGDFTSAPSPPASTACSQTRDSNARTAGLRTSAETGRVGSRQAQAQAQRHVGRRGRVRKIAAGCRSAPHRRRGRVPLLPLDAL